MAQVRYADSHEWHVLDDETITIGLSRFAVDELTDVTFVELPEVGTEVKAGDSIGEIESVKATSEIYSGISGEIVETNDKVVEDPSMLNDDPSPTGPAWLVKIKPSDPSQFEKLMDEQAYKTKYPTA